jgi:aspartyl-tRNA(Asn)/glutamyl-tRNA(Gln) amidotransferase subunit B
MWEAVIGLEVHARLLTRTKIFCGCPTSFGSPPNAQCCSICLGYPGALPVLNRRAVELAVRMAIATGCRVHQRSIFARKNYFYPDLPKGYQISQFDQPLATDGRIGDVGITRIHMEEDAGKLMHESLGTAVDLNRAGTPLIEIVSAPDIRSSAQALTYLTRLRQILMYTGVCDGNMEEGSLRCDANISIRRAGDPLGTRTEVKNLNSFRFLGRAVDHEIERQISVVEGGGRVEQETRLFDPSSGETRVMRSKEEAHDYRYFPDPDLLPLEIEESWIEQIRSSLPELPEARVKRYQQELGIPLDDAEALVASRQVAEYFESAAAESGNARAAANWVRNEVLRVVNDRKIPIESLAVTPSMLARLIRLIGSGDIGGKSAKDVLDQMAATGEAPEQVIERLGLTQISDPDVIRQVAQRIVDNHPSQVAQYRAGNTKLFGFLVGQLMKATGGKANAALANQILKDIIER